MKTMRLILFFITLILVSSLISGFVLTNGSKQGPSVKVLVEGAPIHGANGLYFGPEGNLYIGSVVGGEIVVMNPESGEILQRFNYQQGVSNPDDVFVTADGSIYFTAIMAGEVAKLNIDGSKTIIASGLPGVNPITFSEDGRLFVARDFYGAGLYEMDPNGVNPPRVIIPDLVNLNGFDFGPDGWLYGPIFGQSIVKINVDTGELIQVANYPGSAVKFNSQGILHAVSYQDGEVVKINILTGAVKRLAKPNEGFLDNLAFDANDRLFVSSGTNGTIFEVLPKGKIRIVSPGGLILPGGVAVNPTSKGPDKVMVADFWALRQYHGVSGKLKNEFYSGMGSPMVQPLTIAPDGGNWVLSSFISGAVQVWDPQTNTILESYPSANLPLNAIRFQGDLLVAELMTGQVVRLNAPGDPLVGQFYYPTGMAATDDDLWVADFAAGVVYQVVADGIKLDQPRLVASGLAGPEGLAIDEDGNLLVVESVAGRLSKINLTNGEVTLVADGFDFFQSVPGLPPSAFFNGVTVGASGTIYLTADGSDNLYRIKE